MDASAIFCIVFFVSAYYGHVLSKFLINAVKTKKELLLLLLGAYYPMIFINTVITKFNKLD